MTRTALYRHYDVQGRLLYVGVTDDVDGRERQHRAKSPWFAEVAETRVEWCVSREHAFALERVAVQFEAPAHNVALLGVASDAMPAPIAQIWPRSSDLADDLGLPYMTVHSWRQRGKIPAKYDLRLIEAAKARGAELSLSSLAAARGA